MNRLLKYFFTCTVLLLTTALSGQEFRSTLLGSVQDPSGASVAAAKIIAVNMDTGARSATTSRNDGAYTIPFLPPGTYQLIAEIHGFKRYVQGPIQITTDERLQQDVHLEIGSSAESVTVSADANMLDTASASTGQVINTKQVENMPINGRTPFLLAQLAIGVQATANPAQVRPFDNKAEAQFSIGGAPSQSNELLLNGVPDMTAARKASFSPPIDSVSEVKVEAFQADASFGDTAGGTVSVTTKAGSNNFHGTLYEFNQTSALEATPFFTKLAGLKNTVTRYNQYGGTIGGPVWIPKVYNGKNRLFFFFAYEGLKDSTPGGSRITVPTDAERGGDFSALLPLGKTYQLYDPASAQLIKGAVVRQPLVGNIIPKSRLNNIALNYLKYLPAANQAGLADGTNNLYTNYPSTDDFTSYTARTDINLSERNKLFVDVHENERFQLSQNYFNNIAEGRYLYRTSWNAAVDDVYTLSPSLILDTRLGWTRFVQIDAVPSQGFDPTTLGFPSYIAQNSENLTMPIISLETGKLADGSGSDKTPDDLFQIFSTLTKVAGTHTLKWGTDLRLSRESATSYGASAGSYTFDTTWVRQSSNPNTAQPFGGSIAAFLLGLPTSGSYDINAQSTKQNHYVSFFLQDDWRVKKNLTVNVGLRYEHESPTEERWNRTTSGFDPTAVTAVTAAAQAAYALNPLAQLPPGQFNPLGGLLFADAQHRNPYTTPLLDFSPRAGISWSPEALHGKTVIRSGFGIFYQPFGLIGISQPGFSQSTAMVATNNSYITPFGTLSDPFPGGSIKQPVGSALGVNTYLGQSVGFTNPQLQQPYSIRWNFNIQQQLAKNWMLEIVYAGNHAVHLQNNLAASSATALNAIPTQYLSTTGQQDPGVINALNAVVPNPFAGLLPGTALNGATTTAGALLRPYPQFNGDTGVQVGNLTNGESYYNSIQIGIQKRFGNGLQFMGNYSHSRIMQRDTTLNASEPTVLEKRVSSEDVPNHLVFSASYDLPFGKGRRFLGQANYWENLLAGGWNVTGFYMYQTGLPLDFSEFDFLYNGGALNYDPRNYQHAFNTSAFNTNSTQQLQYNYRTFPTGFNNLRSDGINNLDMSAIKQFQLAERVGLQFRAEMFNTANHVQFSDPNLTPTSKQFGTVTGQDSLPRTMQLALRLVF
jgi:hypothetical protein